MRGVAVTEQVDPGSIDAERRDDLDPAMLRDSLSRFLSVAPEAEAEEAKAAP